MNLFYAGFIALRTLVRGIDVPGYASLLVAVLFLGSLQLISIGLLGEYVGRIYMETKQRPRYLIRKRYQRADTTCSQLTTRTLNDGVVLS